MSTAFEDEDISGFLSLVDEYSSFIEHIVEPAKDIAKDEVLPNPNRERVLSVFSFSHILDIKFRKVKLRKMYVLLFH